MENVKMFDLATGELCRYPFVLHAGVQYDPDATCSHWLQFLDEITCGSEELKTYLKRMVGYCMTDATTERAMFILLGDGSNGKSTFVNTIEKLLGAYDVRRCTPDLVYGRRDTNYDNSILARLRRCRLAILEEPGFDQKLNESAVKRLVNDGDRVAARELYGDVFEFVPVFKIMVAANILPQVDGDSDNVWRRVRVVPFRAHFSGSGKDVHLAEKLEHELPGIFNWALEGAAEWYEHGLPELGGGQTELK